MSEFPAYTLTEQLHASARSLVWRARAADGSALIVKSPNQAFPSFQEITRFKREYAIARRCEHPAIIRPLALRQQQGCWVMLQHDLGARSLDKILLDRTAAGMPLSLPALALDDFFDIALQACEALDAVHRLGIIHKDINPSNLVWNGQRRLLQLIDFGIASELAQESQGLVNPHALEGTLRYIAPEQTGRMNRRADYRADYYSLGATLYELLTGQPLFVGADAAEVVHCQIACAPDWPQEALRVLPPPLVAIVRRLLEKDADRRYQGLHGLADDLRACRAWLREPERAAPVLGRSDRNSRFMVAQKLQGREQEIAALLAAFERTAAGASEMLLVAGYSGIGKSAIINEVHKPIVARRGCFLSGKFDQFRRDVPYASLLQAFQGLIHQLLSEPQARLSQWSTRLQAVLGAGLAVMAELIPELALIVGPIAPAPALPPEQAQIRLGRAMLRFVRVFASAEHPLVIFLDDLQWADAPTLRMIELLMSEREQGHLLFLGAFRDNEVRPGDLLPALCARLHERKLPLTTLTLGPLSEEQTGERVAASLRVAPSDCAALTALCYRKTAGNPFFLSQFLQTIHDAGHLRYRAEGDCWDWDLAALERADYTDNVVELLLEKMRRLPPQTCELLQLAASVGNRFRLDTLAVIGAGQPGPVQRALWPALAAGLIQPLDEQYKYLDEESSETEVAYRFLHDRVQQAAYALAGAGERPARHLRIGRLLLAHAGAVQLEEQLFAVVEQLNAGAALIADPSERLLLAGLNCRAGAKARKAAAFQATAMHMAAGLALLPPQAWLDHFGLWLDLQLGAAEAAYLCGEFAQADALYPAILPHCGEALARIRVCTVRAHQYQLQGRLHEAITVLCAGLAELDIIVPRETAVQQTETDAIFGEIEGMAAVRAPARLLDAPEMDDVRAVAAMQMMQGLWMAAYYAGQQELCLLMVVSMTRLSLRRGSSDFTSVAYVGYAFAVALRLGDYGRGYAFGEMALALARRRANLQTRTLACLMFAALNSHWCRPLRDSIALYDEAFEWALEIGDFVQVGVVAAVRASERLIVGDYLPDLQAALARDLLLMRANGQHAMADCCMAAAVQPLKCLLGQLADSACYDDAEFSEAGFLAEYGGSRLYQAYYLQGKIRNAYLFDSADAEQLADRHELVAQMMRGQAKVYETGFYAALIRLRALGRAQADQRPDRAALERQVEAFQEDLARWAELGPDAGARHHLLLGEQARLRGDLEGATRCYQRGIDAAGALGCVHLQALGNELCGHAWLEQGQARVAGVFLADALARYRQWGAEGKAALLAAQYAAVLGAAGSYSPHGLASTTAALDTGTSVRALGNAALDLHSIMKAAQALANEIGLRNVLHRLIALVCENSGAQIARLLLLDQAQCRLEAECDGAQVTVLQARPLTLEAPADPQLPLTMIRYVLRTGAEAIEDCLGTAPRFCADPYVRQRRPRSALCMPIRQAGRIEGILYLENNLVDASFTRERVEFLRILGAQALISIAHARLHDSLEQRVAERTAQLEDANRRLATLSATDGLTGLANRRHFDEVLYAELVRSRRTGQPLAVIMIDVDHFKDFNDCYGHQSGDECLARVARVLHGGARRASDVIARYGGEEFSLVLPDTDAAHALQMAETLRRRIEQLAIPHERCAGGRVTISLGVAVELADGFNSADSLMRAADAALYRAKHAGRNCVLLGALAPARETPPPD